MSINSLKELKVLIAPSAYKGSLSSLEIAKAIEKGLRMAIPDADIKSIPLADGGDSTIGAIHACLGGEIKELEVIGPLNNGVKASWLKLDNCAIIELANCCGLATIVGQALQPLLSHTYGLGEVLRNCLSTSCNKIMIALGGSASTDGGTGALNALGVKFFDNQNKPLPLGGGYLRQLYNIDLSQLDKRLIGKRIEILTDVTSPLIGKNGAAMIFGEQKGASLEQIEELEEGLSRLANIISNLTGTDLRNMPGSGAAGGTAFGLASLLNAQIYSGFDKIAELIGIKEEIKKADIVITAEGRLDFQSLQGKATGELAKICKNLLKPLFVFPACAADSVDWQDFGITAVYPTAPAYQEAKYMDIVETVAKAMSTPEIVNCYSKRLKD